MFENKDKTLDEKNPYKFAILFLLVIFAIDGFIVFVKKDTKIDRYEEVEICGKKFEIKDYVENGKFTYSFSDDIFEACYKDDDMQELIIDDFINSLEE